MNGDNDKIEAGSLNDLGVQEYNQGNYTKAEEYYKAALAKDPQYYYAFYNLGLLYEVTKKPDLAIENYKSALQINSSYADAHNGIGKVYFEKQDFKEASRWFLDAIKYNPGLKYPYYNMGLIMDKENNTEKAIEYYSKAVELDPSYAKAFNSLGICFYNKKDYQKAKENYEKAIQNEPSMVHPYYNIGLIYEVEKNWKEARDWYQKALKIDSNYEYARKSLKFVEDQLGEYSTGSEGESGADTKKGVLDQFGVNLNEKAQKGKLFEPIGRDQEIQSLLEVLYKRIKNNPVLVGHPGTGKTAIVEGLAKRIVDKKVPEFFLDKVIYELNVGALIAGTTFRGQMEERMRQLIKEVAEKPHVIVFLDEIHTLVGAGRTSESNLDMAQMLKPALARGEFPCIGATTFGEYEKYFTKDGALERRFFPVRVDELSTEDTQKVLAFLKPKIEAHYKLTISDENIKLMVKLTDLHVKKRYFPDKAIDVLEKAASRCALAGKNVILAEDIKGIIAETSGTKFLETVEDEGKRMLDMESFLETQIMGQDEAIDRVSNIVRMTKRRLDLKPERPDGVFLFLGPSGVGKTELARQLCIFLYGSEEKLIKLDMSEFSESHSVSKLIGSPPGYVGYEDQSYLTSKVEEFPSSVLVLDELEKAHPDVIKVFLQVFDEGRLKDNRGKTIFFSDVTIFMTSNAIREWKGRKKSMGFTPGQSEDSSEPNTEAIVEELAKFFPMEFINRIDELILFKPLDKAALKKIVEIKIIKKVRANLSERGLELEVDQSLLDAVIEKGYSPDLGARNLERAFENLVLKPLSNALFAGKLKAPGKIRLGFENNELKMDY